MSYYFNNNQDNSISVEAFDIATDLSVGVFKSMALACKKLYIRDSFQIMSNLRHTKRRSGVKSYKTGIKYYFKRA